MKMFWFIALTAFAVSAADLPQNELVEARVSCNVASEGSRVCKREIVKRDFCMKELDYECQEREERPVKIQRSMRNPGESIEELHFIVTTREICPSGPTGPICKKAWYHKILSAFGITASADTTHVANASPWEILVNVNKDRYYTTHTSLGGGVKEVELSFSHDYEWDKVDKDGYDPIMPGKFKGFAVTGDPTVFLTIIAKMPNGKAKVLDKARPINTDQSVIVTKTGHVVNAKYGTIWQPE